jgi:hypothetical protein
MKILDRFKLTKGELVVLFTFGGMILLPYFAFPDYYRTLQVQAQSQQQQPPMMTINIMSPVTGEEVPVGELTISGTSTDNASTDCTVYADWNNLKPFQTATATGSGGVNDYSRWTFTYTAEYHLITNGINNLNSRLSCIGNDSNGDIANITKSYSVKVIGINEVSESDIGGGTTGGTGEDALGDVDEDTTGGTGEGGRGDLGGGTTGGTGEGGRGPAVESPHGNPSRGTTGSLIGLQ